MTYDEVYFWARVRHLNVHLYDCWEWIPLPTSNGYGRNHKVILGEKFCHRIAWVFSIGKIPDGMKVLHYCDNRRCCNPKHLFLGTQADNIRDMCDKSRQPKGETQGKAKLTEKQVKEIRYLYDLGYKQKELAFKFGVVQQTVSNIIREYNWKDRSAAR